MRKVGCRGQAATFRFARLHRDPVYLNRELGRVGRQVLGSGVREVVVEKVNRLLGKVNRLLETLPGHYPHP